MSKPPLLITVDGPAASGKSTIARRLALILRVPYLYTGAMYRAVAWLAIRDRVNMRVAARLRNVARGLDMSFRLDRRGRLAMFVSGADVTDRLHLPEVSLAASTYVAQDPAIRHLLIARQRRYLERRGLIAEGRDCGSVVFPEAPFKFFLIASPEARAGRRLRDLKRSGVRMSLGELLRQIRRRDRQDQRTELGTLQVQPDSWIIDNSTSGMEGALNQMLRRIKGRVL